MRPEKFRLKRTNLQTHCWRNLSRVKIWQSRQRACLHGGRWGNPPNRGRKIKRVYIQSYKPGVLGWGFLRLLLRLQLGRRPKLTSRERRKLNSRKRMYLFMKASRVVLRGVRLREEPLTWYVMRNSLKYGQFTALNIPKCEHFTHLVCPLRFLVISAIRRQGNVQSFKTYVFRFWAFCYPPWDI